MVAGLKLLDVVAILDDLPERGLRRGQVGTIVEILGSDFFDVEFSDNQGQTLAIVPLRADRLLPLVFQPDENVA